MTLKSDVKLGQFNFDDGGIYIGGCEGGKAHGFGICTGPMGQGEFSGMWQGGFEVSGIFTWSRDARFSGQWMQGKKHGLGVEERDHWSYAGEFTQGSMGRYGIRKSSKSSAKYEGTWTHGQQDGYGRETYADLGSYQGQWLKGCRHGYGVRKSAAYSKACYILDHNKRKSSLTSVRSCYEPLSGTPQNETPENPEGHLNSDMMKATKIGHFLASCKLILAFSRSSINAESSLRRRSRSALRLVSDGFKGLKKKRSTSSEEILRSSHLTPPVNHNLPSFSKGSWSWHDSETDGEVVETYSGEWKQDRRDGFGICARSDGIRYEGEWQANRRHGYGVTYLSANHKEEGKYKDDVLVTKSSRGRLLAGLTIAAKKRDKERVAVAVAHAQKAAQLANQKSDIANSRMESAQVKASVALEVQERARADADKAVEQAKEIKRLEMEALTNKGQTKLKKKPSIPRHQLMMDKNTFKSSKHQSSLQYGMDNIGDTFEPKIESATLFSKPTRPGSLKLLSKNSPAPPTTKSLSSNQSSFIRPHTSTISSTTSTIPSQIFEKIDNYFSYLNDEDGSSHDVESSRSLLSRRTDGNQTWHQRGMDSIEEMEDNFPLLMSFRNDFNPDQSNASQEFRVKKPSSSGRRLTLPSFIKSFEGQTLEKPENNDFDSGISLDMPSSRKVKDNSDVLIVDGQRKFMEVQSCANVASPDVEDLDDDKPADLPKTVKLRTLPTSRRQELGSMPDLNRAQKIVGQALPWKEVEVLSKQKREELQKRRFAEEELRKRSLVIRVGDFKAWLSRNTCGIVIFAINVFFLAIFYVLLK